MEKIVGIVGLGLIGGSIAKTLKKKSPETKIIVYDSDAATVEKALSDKAADEAVKADLRGMEQCGVIFLCAGITAITAHMAKLAEFIGRDALVTDVGSVKGRITEAAAGLPNLRFTGGHPMAGGERAGYEAATDFLFENAYYIITPTEGAESDAERLSAVVSELGAIPVIMTAPEHDKVAAVISHAPHIIASALVNAAAKHADSGVMRSLAAGGFKDITRIASSDSKLWQGIAIENRDEVLSAIRAFRAELDEAERYLTNSDSAELGGYLRLAKNYRDSLPASGRGGYMKTYALTTDLEDRPGAIAVVATVLGVNGLNVKNMSIENSREYEGGVLRVTFGDEESRTRGAELLRAMRFEIYES